ncbi:MAG: FAD binding domain-containing protein, partial [Terriglobales bacterium]
MSDTVRIVLNGTPASIADVPPTTTVLDWLRNHLRLIGTKEGCAEGDCGACTVVLEKLSPAGAITRLAINACITMVGQIDGCGVRTVEGLIGENGVLHPVQSALARSGGTQCGFCTPGIVMSGYCFVAGGETFGLGAVHDALAGNLCRCTGYKPIVDALVSCCPLENDPLDRHARGLETALASLCRDLGAKFKFGKDYFYAPRCLSEALELRAKFPDALILAGGTDLGLLVSQKHQQLPRVIYVGNVRELNVITECDSQIKIGAAVTYSSTRDLLTKHYPSLKSYWSRIGSPQVRNMGTIGGNLGTASPIGDALPILLALDATINVCSKKGGRREIGADRFFIDYRKTALAR